MVASTGTEMELTPDLCTARVAAVEGGHYSYTIGLARGGTGRTSDGMSF